MRPGLAPVAAGVREGTAIGFGVALPRTGAVHTGEAHRDPDG